jgi:hypothetical protein
VFQGKLDGYRESCAKGKPLNEDQKLAVSKYDEVSYFPETFFNFVS